MRAIYILWRVYFSIFVVLCTTYINAWSRSQFMVGNQPKKSMFSHPPANPQSAYKLKRVQPSSRQTIFKNQLPKANQIPLSKPILIIEWEYEQPARLGHPDTSLDSRGFINDQPHLVMINIVIPIPWFTTNDHQWPPFTVLGHPYPPHLHHLWQRSYLLSTFIYNDKQMYNM